MEDSSETMNPPVNSNLRDLILQKLSAAREQKLKQNRSTNSLLTSKSKTIPSNSNTWEEEKQVLVNLFEKSQNLVNQITLEKKDLQSINAQLEAKIKELENEVVRAKNRCENGFVEEIKRLELSCVEKDKKAKDDARKFAELEEKISDLNEMVREREKELEKLKKSLRGSKGFNEKVAQSLQEMKLEKEKSDKTLKVPERELQLMDEVNKQKALISQLRESKETKEKELRTQVQALTNENKQLKNTKSPLKNSDQSELLTELQKAYETIASYEKHKEDQKSLDELHFAELKKKNGEVSELLSEISELRHKILIFESKKYESELMIVRTDLHKAIAEKLHAKKLLICYIRSVQQLEKMLNERSATGEEDQVLRLENSRLNEENKGLVEAKLSQEEFYVEEIKKLQRKIDGLNGEVNELEGKVDACQKLRLKENNEEMKSWVLRNRQLQEVNRKLVESMGTGEAKQALVGKKRGGTLKEAVKIH